MYVRPQGYRYPSGVRLPENYSGSTFREEAQNDITDEPIEDEAVPAENTQHDTTDGEEKNSAPASLLSNGFRLRLGSLFGGKGIGTEELLIIALILLLADSDDNDDLILFLILLFFIK